MIGFIGLGVMGEPICRHLAAKSGQPVLAYDLRPEPLQRLAAHGVKGAVTLRELAERCDVVFLSLPGAEQVEEVCVGGDRLLIALRAGSYVVDLSTAPVALARDLHERFAARGIHFLDAPVARTRAAAEQGTLSIMVGGAQADFARLRPLLGHFASDVARAAAGRAPARPSSSSTTCCSSRTSRPLPRRWRCCAGSTSTRRSLSRCWRKARRTASRCATTP